jgi:predicted Zn-dependent protease
MTFAFAGSDRYERWHGTALHPVKPLEPPDSHHLEAAEGWAGLLAFGEAAGELAKIHPNFRDHPDVLEIRWLLAANSKKWTEALAVAKGIVSLVPEKPNGWVYQGNALLELNRGAEAYAILQAGQKLFPDDEIIAYDLACACCSLGRLEEALRWIGQSIDLARDEMRRRARVDPRLKPIWKALPS